MRLVVKSIVEIYTRICARRMRIARWYYRSYAAVVMFQNMQPRAASVLHAASKQLEENPTAMTLL
jgi:hypothetical protein